MGVTSVMFTTLLSSNSVSAESTHDIEVPTPMERLEALAAKVEALSQASERTADKAESSSSQKVSDIRA
jgi:hypothetical protein